MPASTAAKIGSPKDLLAPQPTGGRRPDADGRMRTDAGDLIFEQGDPGGDLYFIEDGEIEIVTYKDGQEIVLDKMVKGEILGVMTCLTSEPRMATARARTPVTCKVVPHDNIKKVLAALPNWMRIVLKEFSVRLGNMNKLYSETVLRLKKVEENQITNLHQAALLASAFAAVAEFLAKDFEDTKLVVVEDLMVKLEFVLNIRREELDRLFAVLLESGLVRIEIEPEKKQTVVRLENARKLAFFAQFVRESRHGSTKKLVRAKFSNRETRVLSAMVKMAMRLKMDLEKPCKLALADLEASLEKSTGVKFEREALNKAIELQLLAIEGGGGRQMAVFRPSFMGRTVACIEAVRKFAALDEQKRG